MVMAAISVLSIIVTEFAYVAQVNERMAYDSMDQVKAHYLAKAGVKLSLMRLKAYAQLKQIVGGSSSGGSSASNPLAGAIPHSVLDKVWNFPFMYPLPQLPEMSVSQKDAIDAFTKTSSLEGRYSAIIESESSKFNLNSILPGFQAPRSRLSPVPPQATMPNRRARVWKTIFKI
jgi:general secretion pathway protein K